MSNVTVKTDLGEKIVGHEMTDGTQQQGWYFYFVV